MNLNLIAKETLHTELLNDGTWQKVDFYDLSTSSTFWNRAAILTLDKKNAATVPAALIYLIQKETRVLGIWQSQWNTRTPKLLDFINFFVAEKGFSNIEGKLISVDAFWDSYSTTIAGISSESDFESTKNEKKEPFTEPIKKETILQVVCFDDEWNEHNFLIETEDQWVLYHWASAA